MILAEEIFCSVLDYQNKNDGFLEGNKYTSRWELDHLLILVPPD